MGQRKQPAVSSAERLPQMQGMPMWRIVFIGFCLIGALLSADLLRLHVRVHTDTGYQSYCTVSAYIDCEAVALSDYAVFGGLPVALWGIAGYLVMGGLCAAGWRRRLGSEGWPAGLLLVLSLFSLLAGLGLFAISHWVIESMCLLCMATYAVNGILCITALGALRKHRVQPLAALRQDLFSFSERRRFWIPYVGTAITAIVLAVAMVPPYWQTAATAGPGGIRVGTADDGAHWIGARRPVIEIVEFSDYQCPYCRRAHADIRKTVAKSPDAIRLEHRHYPLRRHPHAFDYAVLANCAGRQDRFWEANDYLFANGLRNNPVTAPELAKALHLDPSALGACVAADVSRAAVTEGKKRGGMLGVDATPTFFIDGKKYVGRVPSGLIESLLNP